MTKSFARSLATSSSARALLLVLAGSTSHGAVAQTAPSPSLPTGGNVSAGSATILPQPQFGSLTINQTSDRAAIDWQSFNVGAGGSVNFVQPNAQSATLNRVAGNFTSTIAGRISATGQVYLINPNGIAITPTGSVQTGGGFVASTLDLTNADFMAGKLRFNAANAEGSGAGVANAGSITAGSAGFVALLGSTVSNTGTISVPLGKVGLGSGSQATLDLNGDGFLQVALPTDRSTPAGAALIEQAGRIEAAGGRVIITVATARAALRNAINMPGSISADSLTSDGGMITLLGGDGGKVTASGTLTARGGGASGNGGNIETSGAAVDFTGLKVDTSATSGKTGTWLVDPTNLTVDAAAATTINTNLATSNVTLQTNADGTTAGPGTTSAGNGDITIASALGWSSTNTLTLNAFHDIALNAAITAFRPQFKA